MNIPFLRHYTTKQFTKWWTERKIDWQEQYLKTWNHPHRYLITALIKEVPGSVFEIGCGAGANLVNIVKNIPNIQVGGVDVNPEAIALAQQVLQGAMLKVNPGDDVMASDKCADTVLTDMTLIYVGPRKIKKYLNEIKRLGRKRVLICELHSTSFWKRLKLLLTSGHHAYDWPKTLKKHGFYDIDTYKIPKDMWPDDNSPFRYIFVAKIPKWSN